MLAFEISYDDVIHAAHNILRTALDEGNAGRILKELDLQAVSDAANYSDDEEFGLHKATERAEIEIVRQIEEKEIPLFI